MRKRNALRASPEPQQVLFITQHIKEAGALYSPAGRAGGGAGGRAGGGDERPLLFPKPCHTRQARKSRQTMAWWHAAGFLQAHHLSQLSSLPTVFLSWSVRFVNGRWDRVLVHVT